MAHATASSGSPPTWASRPCDRETPRLVSGVTRVPAVLLPSVYRTTLSRRSPGAIATF